MLSQIDLSMKELTRFELTIIVVYFIFIWPFFVVRVDVISLKDSRDVKERMENDLLEEYDKFIIEKGREERQIVTKAEVALKVAEKELSKFFQHKYFSSEYTLIQERILLFGGGRGGRYGRVK